MYTYYNISQNITIYYNILQYIKKNNLRNPSEFYQRDSDPHHVGKPPGQWQPWHVTMTWEPFMGSSDIKGESHIFVHYFCWLNVDQM